MWTPAWGDDPGWRQRFEEPWRRFMVRLSVGAQLASWASVLREKDQTDRLLEVIGDGAQTAQIAKLMIKRNLRIETPAEQPDAADVRAHLAELSKRYETTRASMDASPERTRAMEAVISDARRVARAARYTPNELRKLLNSLSAGERLVGLAVVQATAEPVLVENVLRLVRSPETPFESYHALRALESLRSALDAESQAGAIELLQAPKWRASIASDSSRMRLADRILKALPSDAAADT